MTTYNGYPNRETWAFVLWADNDQGTYNYAREIAESVGHDANDYDLGSIVVESLTDLLAEARDLPTVTLRAGTGNLLPDSIRRAIADAAHDAALALGDIGSTERIDRASVGEWARELVAA